jgi:hypothetical protein
VIRSKVGLAVLLALLLLVVPFSAAYAQDGRGDKVIFGQNFVLHSGERVQGNLTEFGGNVTLEEGSRVDGDVAVMGGSLSASGGIGGNLSVLGGSVDLTGTADVGGDLAAFGGSLHRAPGATIHGRTTEGFGVPRLGQRILPLPLRNAIPNGPAASSRPLDFLGGWIRWEVTTVAWALVAALLGVAAVLVFPRPVGRVASTVVSEPAVSLGLGLLTLVVALFGGALLLLACGLGLLVWLATMAGLLVGWIAIGLWVGQLLLGALRVRTASSLAEVALGAFVISVIQRVPCLGPVFGVLVGAIGLGAVVLTRFGTRSYSRTTGAPAGGPGSAGPGTPGGTTWPASPTGGYAGETPPAPEGSDLWPAP